ncbi:MAG: competence protein CoiA family protein [Candidatus Thiodiazotropha sp. LLP2]|nr:hypothetical protein [Candidatus Thiodiazotropha lotti]MCG8010489.1 hypothetical protein [Candidatus Thiodiazotropha lotti]MCW4209949.1 competence protein CoiA family protein [Candidatus Thiodiazotropha lotti]MCW4216730.1 competence protein CoiA family protein [Candidatus Thiodiazotropha lotti]
MSGFNLIPFGYNPTNDTFVDVEDVPRGANCGCICPACKTPLIARQGEEKEWHFAHASRKVYERTQKECEFSFYLSVRMMARQIIGNELKLTLPEYRDSVSKYIPDLGCPLHDSFVITDSKEISLTNVSVETNFEGVAVDIVGYISDFKFAIYFTHPGRGIPQELKSPKDRHCGVIAIALDNLAGTLFRQAKNKKQSYQFALIEFLSSDMPSKQWVFHPRYERCHQQALARVDVRAESIKRGQQARRGKPERTKFDSAAENIHYVVSTEKPVKQRVLYECVMCNIQWIGFAPGACTCPKCNNHLYSSPRKVLQPGDTEYVNVRDATQIPPGEHCYRVVELAEGEVLSEEIERFGKDLREFSYRPGLKEILCPYWRKTDFGMARCDYLEQECLNEDEENALEKAVAHYGGREQFEINNKHSLLYDEIKICGISTEADSAD